MKKYDKNAEKLSDKAFSHFVFMSLLTIIICIFGLCGATYAWFVASTDSSENIVRSGVFELDIRVTDPLGGEVTVNENVRGNATYTLGAETTYTVTLGVSENTTVSRGHCVVYVNDEIYSTETIHRTTGEPYVFTIETAHSGATVSFDANWGPANGQHDSIESSGAIKLIKPIITNEEFTYGSYLDGSGPRKTHGSYGLLRAADAVLVNQDITIKVTANNYTNYKVTLAYYSDPAGENYKGKTGILPMTDGVIQIPATSISSPYFRVNVMIYGNGFSKVPADTVIEVYGGMPPISNETPDGPNEEGGDGETSDKKTVSIIGDSMSVGGWTSTIGNLLNAEIDNNAVSGTKITGSGFMNQLSNISPDADLIIIFGGTNDYWHKNCNIGTDDSTGTSTFIGSLKAIINYLKTNHPDAEYLFVFPADQTFQGNSCTTDFGKGTFDDFRQAFIKVCTDNGVHCLDLEESSDYDCSVHSGDGVHPNATGYSIIANAMYKYVKDNIEF